MNVGMENRVNKLGLAWARHTYELIIQAGVEQGQSRNILGNLSATDTRVPEVLQRVKDADRDFANAVVLYHKELFDWMQAQQQEEA